MISSSHLRLWSHLGHRPPTSFLQASRFWASLASCPHVLPICIQVTAPGVSRPPSLPFPFGVPCEGLPCCIGCRLAKGVAYPPPTSLKDVFFNWLLVCSSP
ncbi:hypothetical protein DPMN_036252 [Dreissena polymorpha]|uniref:Uncharacterized protein n=1 Tax=Dreissena polymorpha TaxID=45954 RepID=A0A9D4MCL6_DREPO|nr:hypothetical protein DPMN_036252 [Dreissena polymorpha]